MATKQLFNNFFDDLDKALNQSNIMQLSRYASDDLQLKTNFIGDYVGVNALSNISKKFTDNYDKKAFRITNRHISFNENEASQSGYLIGLLANKIDNPEFKYFQFGSHFVTKARIINNQIKIDSFKIEIDWIDHNGLIPTNIESSLNNLQLNPKILSEIDSPWRVFPNSYKNLTTEEQLIDTYIKYTWSIDQQDFGQMLEVFTPDAKADMSPFGDMDGRFEIVSKLKVLRDGQPYFQHSAHTFKVNVIDDAHATMKIFRNVPFTPSIDTINQKNVFGDVYGAYYESKLVKVDGIWKFKWLQYIPGWVTA